MNIRTFRKRHAFVWNSTKTNTPPVGEILAVVHRFANLPGGMKFEEAIWDGKYWIRMIPGPAGWSGSGDEKLNLNHYNLWRRLET